MFLVPAGQASAAELLTNGGFETGTFSGWTTTQLASPYTPWAIATASTWGGMSAATPQEGTYDAMNGFDGGGPGSFTLSQTVALPTGPSVLRWKDRIQHGMSSGAEPRLMEVKLLDPGTEAVLATLHTFTTGDNSVRDTGWQAHSVDLSAFGGRTVKLLFEETIPENFTGPGQIEFDAISVMPVLSTSPASLPFGSRDVDEGSTPAQASTVTNSGTGPVALSALTLSGDAASFERLSGQAGDCAATTVLAAGATCDVRVRFDPTTRGVRTATLTVASDAGDRPLALTGSGTQTELTPSPATLDLGSRDVDDGPTADQRSTVTNTGTEPVTLGAPTLSGDAAQFETLSGGTGDCAAGAVLVVGGTCDVRVRFDPTATGATSATLAIPSDAAEIAVALRGAGTQTDPDVGAPPPTPPAAPADAGAVITAVAHPAKMTLRRATIHREDRVLDVLASITSRASGRVIVELRAAGQSHRFTAPVDPDDSRIRIRGRIPAAQARLGTGIVTVTYAGDGDTRPQTVRLRSADHVAAMRMERPRIVDGRIVASGTVDSRARGVVRLQLEYDRGGDTALLRFRAPVADGRWSLDEELPATTLAEIESRRGTLHSSTLFSGYMPERIRGEMRSLQVLAGR